MTEGTVKEHRTVSRVTTILEAAAASTTGASLGELATLLAAPKSSVHYLVKGLLATGYLQETAEGRYEIGPAVAMLSSSGLSSVLASAHRSLETIQRGCNESATLCTLIGSDVVYVDNVESTQMIRYSAPLRVRRPIYPTSAGKCFLAFMPEAKRSKYLGEYVQGAANLARAEAELRDVARNGYAMNRGETVPDVFAVASPIIIGDTVMACLQVAGPGGRMDDRMDDIAELVVGEARRLSRRG
jgi:DNA-binding IclR family transcriptional regulator